MADAPQSDDTENPAPPRRRPMLLIVLALLVVAAGGAYHFYGARLFGAANDGAAAAQAPMPALPVTVSQPLHRQITEWDEFTGQFAAVDYVEIRARVSGYLTEIHFQDGQIVKQGDLLFVIDPRPYEAMLASARAQLSQANAQVDLATRQLNRSATLRKQEFETASSYDQRVADLRVAGAAVETAKAAIRTAELNVEFTHIVSPVTGRIGSHLVSVGNLVTGGEGGATTMLTTVVSLDPIYFNFDMSEAAYLAYQRAALRGALKSTRDNTIAVFAHLTDETGWPREGSMNFLDNQVDRGSGTIRGRAVFANPDLLLVPGQFGRIRIPGSEPHMAVLVPDSAVVTDQSSKLVMTVADDGTVVPKVIRPGPIHGNLRIVRSGLTGDERIIINGLMRARPGSKVAPQPGKIEFQPD